MRSLTIIFLMILLVSATFMARAQVPRFISYQGLYTDTLGVPKPDGDYRFTFRFYADSVGGNALWPLEQRTLRVKRGLFSVLLGGQPGFESVFSGQRWMSLQVDPDPEIQRRIQLASTAYAFRAIRADTAQFALNAPLEPVADSARIAGTVANNSITSAKILDGTILFQDIGQNGAAAGQVMKWTGTAWAPRPDSLGSGGGVSGIGEVGGVAFWNTPTNLTSTPIFVWDNQNARLGIGAPSPQEKLDVNGTIRLRNMPFGSGSPVGIDSAGRLVRPGSSRNFKTNIRPLEPSHVLELKPVRFRWKSTGEEDIGLIAEEVNEICADLVVFNGEGKPNGVKYDKVAVYLLDILKDQQRLIAELQSAVKVLQENKSSMGDLK